MAKPTRSSSRRAPAVKGKAAPPSDDIDVTLPEGSVDLNGPAQDEYPADAMFDSSSGANAPLTIEADEGVDEAAQTVVSGNRASQRRASAKSSAKSGNRSSQRRSASTKSANISARTSARRELTPEERIKAAKARAAVMRMISIVGFVAVVIVALWYFVLRTDPRVEKYQGVLASVDGAITGIGFQITNQQADQAEAAIAQATKDLDATPCPEKNQELLARKAADQAQLKDLAAKVDLLKRDMRVQSNKAILVRQFKDLDNTATDLDKLEADVNAFIANPADPTAAADKTIADAYATDTSDMQKRLSLIQSARSRRLDITTNAPVTDARDQATNLIKQDKYQDALALVDDLARKNPNAKFDAVRGYVTDSAADAWKNAKAEVENAYADYSALGTAPDVRKDALAKARQILHHVIDNYGIDDYVNQAKAELAKYPE